MKWFAIFRTGLHKDSAGNEKQWSESDLDKIAGQYDPLKHEAPIVIGHPKTNVPAFGWIDKLKRVGDTLYALPKNLEAEFVEMINKGLFKKRSISLYPDGSLRHVGFLGAQPPAVKGLPDVEFSGDEKLETVETVSPDDLNEDGLKLKEYQEQIAEYSERIKLLENKGREFEELKTRFAQITIERDTLARQIDEQKRLSQLEEFSEILDKAVSEGRLLPKMKGNFSMLFEVLSTTPPYEFTEGVKTPPADVLSGLISLMPKLIEFKDTPPPAKTNSENEPASRIVAEVIREQMSID